MPGEHAVCDAMSNIEEDRIHPRFEKGWPRPPPLNVDDKVEEGEEEEGEAIGDQDKG